MKRPTDINQLGKMIVDLSVGEIAEGDGPKEPTPRQLASRKAAAKMTPAQRHERAKRAAAARWKNGA